MVGLVIMQSCTAAQNTYWDFQEGFGLNNLDVVHVKDRRSLAVRQDERR